MFHFFPPNGSDFEATYRAFPLAFIDKQAHEYGDKVILPPTALHSLGAPDWRRQLGGMHAYVGVTRRRRGGGCDASSHGVSTPRDEAWQPCWGRHAAGTGSLGGNGGPRRWMRFGGPAAKAVGPAGLWQRGSGAALLRVLPCATGMHSRPPAALEAARPHAARPYTLGPHSVRGGSEPRALEQAQPGAPVLGRSRPTPLGRARSAPKP
jgi:hypothetical protein